MLRAAHETLPDYAHRSYYEVWFAAPATTAPRARAGPGRRSRGRPLAARARADRRCWRRPMCVGHRAWRSDRKARTTRPDSGSVRRVRTHLGTVPHHTRLPGYANGKVGVVERAHGVQVLRRRARAEVRGATTLAVHGRVHAEAQWGRRLRPDDGFDRRLGTISRAGMRQVPSRGLIWRRRSECSRNLGRQRVRDRAFVAPAWSVHVARMGRCAGGSDRAARAAGDSGIRTTGVGWRHSRT